MNQETNNQLDQLNTEPINEVNNNEIKVNGPINIPQVPIQPITPDDNNINDEVLQVPIEEINIEQTNQVQAEVNNQPDQLNTEPINEVKVNEPINIPQAPIVEPTIDQHIQISQSEPTPIPEVPVVEYNQSSENTNPMKEPDNQNNKSPMSIFIIFGIFIVLIIGLPYIDEIMLKIKSDKQMQQLDTTPEPTTTTEPVVEPTEEPEVIPESYTNCGSAEVFKTITIDYTTNNQQCFKINLGTEKTTIKYVPAENDSWNIQLGDKIIYSGNAQVTISTINITDTNQIQLIEKTISTQIEKVYTYDNTGEQIKEVMQ